MCLKKTKQVDMIDYFHRFDYEKDLQRHFTKLLILFFFMGRVGPEI